MTEQPIEIAELKDGENQLSTSNKTRTSSIQPIRVSKGT
jgi:hypothetical protein